TKLDVDLPAIGAPTRDARRKVLVRVGDAAVVFFFVFVFDRVGRWIATQPEMLDEVVALLVGGEAVEGGQLFRRDDPPHVFVETILVDLRLSFQALGLVLFLLRSQLALERILLFGTVLSQFIRRLSEAP